jgi:hypothetical protein
MQRAHVYVFSLDINLTHQCLTCSIVAARALVLLADKGCSVLIDFLGG